MNKKAFEVSVNFVVILIISIIVFTMGISIVNRFFQFAEDEKLRWDQLTRSEIDSALDQGDRIAIPRFKKEIVNGEFASFGVGILNVLQGPMRNFRINIDFALASDRRATICEPATASACGEPNNWIRTAYDDESPIIFTLPIKNNEKKSFLVGFDVIGAADGTYVFNVNIEYDQDGNPATADWAPYDTTHKLYVEVKGGSLGTSSVMTLTSTAFSYGNKIPAVYTCGATNPQLKWSNAPSATQSFAVILDDPDASGSLFTHWLVKNIPVGTTEILQGGPVPGVQVTNSYGIAAYRGPCPPGAESHRYFFKVYALDVPTLSATTINEFYSEVAAHKITKAGLMGKYK